MLSINQDKRLWFIELIAWWEGRIASSHLIRQFGISRTQAQNDIAYYQHLLPHNLQYHTSQSGFLPQSGFVQAYISSDVFVSTGLCWHLRACCEKSQQYRDFVLSRLRGVPDLLNKANIDAQQDRGWNTQLTLSFQPSHWMR